MSTLHVINPLNYPVYDVRTKGNSNGNITTFFTVDDKKASPLVGVHYPDMISEPGMNTTLNGEIKVTKKLNSKFFDCFVDFVYDEDNHDIDSLIICAIPVAGIVKSIKFKHVMGDALNATEIKPLKVCMAKYGKQDVPVTIIKKDTADAGRWGFDKIMYIIAKLDNCDSALDFFDVDITADHCGRTTNADGKYEITTRNYGYHIDIEKHTADISVEYAGRATENDRPIGTKIVDAGKWVEINPYEKKAHNTDKPNHDHNKSYTTDKKHEFVNRPRFKNNNDLKIPDVPEEWNRKNNGKKKGKRSKKSRSNYDY